MSHNTMTCGNAEYERYIHSNEWHKIAEKRMLLDNHTCRVCGKKATDVHHLTYEHFRHEEMSDLVSLCRKCHEKAEEIYDPKIYLWSMAESTPNGNNFMAALRVDAVKIAPVVFEHIMLVRGRDFDSLMSLRKPTDLEGKNYWSELKIAVDALCRKRYVMNCAEDRTNLMLEAISNRVASIALSQIEHSIRNSVQKGLHDAVETEYAIFEKWKDVSEYLGISSGTLQKLKNDDGTSFGPSLRETVLYYCGLDASAGINPISNYKCLTQEDYSHLIDFAEYARCVSGNGHFKGELQEDNNNA